MHSSSSRRPLTRALGIGVLITSCILSRPCLADDRATPASEWVRLGVDDFNRNDYEGARIAFGHAYSVEPTAKTLIGLALAELQSGHAVDAVRHLRLYVKDPGAEPAKVEAVRSKWLPRAEEQTSRLVVEAPTAAEILVDGLTRGLAPLADPIDVSAGDHDVIARLGPWSRAMHVHTTNGQLSRARFETADQPAAPAVAPVTPPSPPRPLPAMPEPSTQRGPSSAKVITVISIGGAALASAGLGLAFSLKTNTDASTAAALSAALPSDHACTGSGASSSQCVGLRQAINTWNQDHGLGIGFYIAGGALAGMALVTWFVWPNQKTQSAWFVRPAVGVHTAGALLEGAF